MNPATNATPSASVTVAMSPGWTGIGVPSVGCRSRRAFRESTYQIARRGERDLAANPLQWHANADLRAGAGTAGDAAITAEQRDALAHPEQPEVSRARPRLQPVRRQKAATVVGDNRDEIVVRRAEHEANPLGGGVRFDVLQRLVQHAEDRGLGLERQRTGIVNLGRELPARILSHLLRLGRERAGETEVVERRRPKAGDEAARLLDRLAQVLHRLLQAIAALLWRRVGVEHLQMLVCGDQDRGDAVVEVARQTPSLLLVRGHQLLGEVLQVDVELGPLDRGRGLIGEDAQRLAPLLGELAGKPNVDRAERGCASCERQSKRSFFWLRIAPESRPEVRAVARGALHQRVSG